MDERKSYSNLQRPGGGSNVVAYQTPMRRKKQSRPIWPRILSLLFFMGLFSLIFTLNSEMFQIKEIDVQGFDRVDRETIIRASGIQMGQNMLSYRASDAERGILKKSLIVSVRIKRELPSKVRIIVQERQPYAYIKSGSRFYMVDKENVVLQIDKDAGNRTLRRLYSDNVQNAEVGRELVYPFSNLTEMFFDKAESTLGSFVKRIYFNSGGIKLVMRNDTFVLVGDGRKLKQKLSMIPLLVHSLEAQNQPYAGINVRNVGIPTFIHEPGAEVASAAASESGAQKSQAGHSAPSAPAPPAQTPAETPVPAAPVETPPAPDAPAPADVAPVENPAHQQTPAAAPAPGAGE